MAGYHHIITCLSLSDFLLQEGNPEHVSELGKGFPFRWVIDFLLQEGMWSTFLNSERAPSSSFRWGGVQTKQWGGICSLFAMAGLPNPFPGEWTAGYHYILTCLPSIGFFLREGLPEHLSELGNGFLPLGGPHPSWARGMARYPIQPHVFR